MRYKREVEDTHSGKFIVLSSHADTLQIFQTFLSGEDPRKFATYRFKNGEVRNMEVLPTPVEIVYK
jgi:broad specificity phosphatase PhoE